MPSYKRLIPLPGRTSVEIFDAINKTIEPFLGKLLMGNVNIGCDRDSRIFSVSHSMFSGTVKCLDGAAEVEAKLGLMALPFRSKIDGGIDSWLAKVFPKRES